MLLLMIRSLPRTTRKNKKMLPKLMKQLKKILEPERAAKSTTNLIETRSEMLAPTISARRQDVVVVVAEVLRMRRVSIARRSLQQLPKRLRSRRVETRIKRRVQHRLMPSPIRCSRRMRARLRRMRMMLANRALTLRRAKHSQCNPLPRVTRRLKQQRLAPSNLSLPYSKCLTLPTWLPWDSQWACRCPVCPVCQASRTRQPRT